jgi:hypothetical protein
MANRKSPSEIARRENWKAIYAGAKRRKTERSSLPEDVPQKPGLPSQNETDARTRVIYAGFTRNAIEKPRRGRNIAVPESTEKGSPAPHMDTVRRVLRKREYPSTDEVGNRSPVIPNVTRNKPATVPAGNVMAAPQRKRRLCHRSQRNRCCEIQRWWVRAHRQRRTHGREEREEEERTE